MRVKIGELDRGQREEMFNLHAMYVNPEARESAFNLFTVPVKTIDLTSISDEHLYSMTQDAVTMYSKLIENKATKYPIISGTFLIDGLHRITTEKMNGKTTMEVLDFGKLINPEESGFQFEITLIDEPKIKTKIKP
jgi:hypothetical protein